MHSDDLRDGIFAQQTRRFGDITEIMMMYILHCEKGKNVFYDLYDSSKKQKLEVKFSRVQQTADTAITQDNILRCIEEATIKQRAITFSNYKTSKFDCNIQQIKRNQFDVLYYGLFFYDCVKIFRINSSDIKTTVNGGLIGYSDKQHAGNVGEGQFHINQNNLNHHLNNYLIKTLTYDDLLELLTPSINN